MFLRGGLSVEHRSVASSNSIVTDYHYAAFAEHTLSLPRFLRETFKLVDGMLSPCACLN